MTLWHNGPIEEYVVRDCSVGDEEKTFYDFDEANDYLVKRRQDWPDHLIVLIALIES